MDTNDSLPTGEATSSNASDPPPPPHHPITRPDTHQPEQAEDASTNSPNGMDHVATTSEDPEIETKGFQVDQDEDDDFGEFVYSGKDAETVAKEVKDYQGQMEEALGEELDQENDTSGETETEIASKKQSRRQRNGGHTALNDVDSDEFPSLVLPSSTSSTPPPTSKRPLASRASYGGSPSPSPSSPAPSTSNSTIHYPRRPSYHPQISRLRSISTQYYPVKAGPSSRFVSSSTYNTAFEDFPQNYSSRPPLYPSPSTSAGGFDNLSRRSSTSNIHALDFPSMSDLPNGESETSAAASSAGGGPPSTASPNRPLVKTIKWSPLKRISSRISPAPPPSNGTSLGVGLGSQGSPTVMAVSGIIVIGTTKGWTMVFDFGQNLRCICGTEAIAKECGSVTAVAISQDHTFIAAGHENGSIHLYSLLKPSIPARSVPPTTLPQVLTGRKEGHLQGTRILHLGFIGARHTAIVSADEMGLSFYHSLGKVLMLASTDIIRMLGNYPDPNSYVPPSPPNSIKGTISPPLRIPTIANGTRKKPSTILSMSPLPLGPIPHPPSDPLNLVALLTPTKLVVVGLKPVPRTWWRFSFPRSTTSSDETESNAEGSETGGSAGKGYEESGILGWWPSYRRSTLEGEPEVNGRGDGKKEVEVGEDPMLAWAWGKRVRLVRVKSNRKENEVLPKSGMTAGVDFVEMGQWDCDSRVLGLRWYSETVIVILTATHVDVFDITTRERIGRDIFDIRSVASNDFYSNAFDSSVPKHDRISYSTSFTTYKRKLFMLGTSDVRAGAVLSWADRILALMQPSTILSAIETTTAYLEGQVDASTITLPSEPDLRRPLVEPKLREILNASLDFVFSEERLRDGSHSDGESTKRLFEGLVATCVRACHALGDVDWLFDELYERYEENGIEGIFLHRIEPFVLGGAVDALPPSVSQRLIAIHEERHQFEAAQRIIVSVDPELLDLNQALGLCQRHKLYDALIHVYSRAMHDYVAPLVELLSLVRKITRNRRRRPTRTGREHDEEEEMEEEEDETFSRYETPRRRQSSFDEEQLAEAMAPDAYKIFAYLSQALIGLSYPRNLPLPSDEAVKARKSIYGFLFSGRTLSWPEKGGKPVLTSIDEDGEGGGGTESTYPYVRLLLLFDAEATLDTLDLAFEDSYLDDAPLNRQQILDILLEIMPPSESVSDFSAVDRTFLHIFLARNLPKYPQFVTIPSATLHEILVHLATDSDQSTIDDRQLAAEYLLSTYTPSNIDEAIELFENAGFFRILRSIYRGERRWASLASTYLRDPDVGSDIFDFLRETLKLAGRTSGQQKQQLASTILEAVPSLIQADEAGLQRTAELVDSYLPSHHADVVARLASSEYRQFAYLRCLLEPSHADFPDSNYPSAAIASKDRQPSTKLEPAQRLQYLSLLSKHDPQHVIRYLESDDSISKTEEALRVCEREEAFDAVVWAVDKRGETKAALVKADETLETRTDLLLQSLLEGDGGEEEEEELDRRRRTPEALLAQISAISAAATTVCSIRSSGRRRSREITPEDLWFGLLSSLVSTVRSIRAVVPSPVQPLDRSPSSHRRTSNASMIIHDEDDEDPTALSPRASELLSSLIPTALSALVSTTSSREVSFPRLVRRLIESNSHSPAANRSYSEFKSIVSSMLDTYAFEGDILSLSSKISSQDLFTHVEIHKTERLKGWRPGAGAGNEGGGGGGSPRGECAECLQPVWGPRGQGQALSSPSMSRSASVSMVVEQLGMTGRPRMKKRPSLKGKEVDWPELQPTPSALTRGGPQGELKPLSGVVVGRDGRLWHQSCHLLRTDY
ncbi:CORVET complex membrane-binding subunit VPS8 [Sporobolomyces salmoneus]|uniref:CORVET complex membrane-binding subunit VPS8 n=1 Tax=Sporobolomyces salmoneus TaxID=183962 RepID=UPI00317369A4